jgi:redox-sensitive bicupin YhaK (pirin superfamily)
MRRKKLSPRFTITQLRRFPAWEVDGAKVTLIAGEAYGHVSPVKALSPILYLDIQFPSGGTFVLNAEYSERAIYPLTEGIIVAGTPSTPMAWRFCTPASRSKSPLERRATAWSIGGEPLGERHKWWNFVSSRPGAD